jgi:hypothetical protein
MAWYSGSSTAAKGAMITLLDTELVKNSHWTIFDDSAGTNAKVYRCYDPDDDTLFYWYVDDDVHTDYCQTKLYETWDAGAHTGTGETGAYSNFRHKDGTYNISLDDTQLIYVDETAGYGNACFVGRVKAIDPTLPQMIAIMAHDGASYSFLPITGNYDASYQTQVLLRGPTGISTQKIGWVGMTAGIASTTYFTNWYSVDANGDHWFQRGWIHDGYRLLGYIEGVIPLGTTATFGHGDIIAINGEDWKAIKGQTNGYALIKK